MGTLASGQMKLAYP